MTGRRRPGNAWLLIVFLLLILTTPFNSLVNHRDWALWWYLLVSICGLWLLVRIVYAGGKGK